MSGEAKGKVIKVLDQQSGGNWINQQFVIESSGKYPKKTSFTLWNDNCDFIPAVGDEVTVSYNPESREYNEKWYTDLKAWKVKVDVKAAGPEKTGLVLDEEPTVEDEGDILPF